MDLDTINTVRPPDCCVSQDVRKLVFSTFPCIFEFYIINEAHQQYRLLDTISKDISHFGPPGKHR